MKLAAIFTDHMVLQRRTPIALFGEGSGHGRVDFCGTVTEFDAEEGISDEQEPLTIDDYMMSARFSLCGRISRGVKVASVSRDVCRLAQLMHPNESLSSILEGALLTRIYLENRDAFDALAEMLEKYPLAVPITKLGSYTDTNDSCGAQCVTSFGLSSGASVKLQINQDHESGGLHGFKRWNLYTPEEVANSGGFTRFNVGASENGISVRSVMIHEYGHALHARARFLERYGFFSDRSTFNKGKAAQKSVADAYNLAKQNGDIKKLSRYASTKPEEFFAECFAAREDGEKLPS